MSENYDDIFAQYAAQKEKEANFPSNRGSSFKTYEEIHQTALEKGKTKVFRAVGGPPNSNLERDKGSGAKIVTVSWITGDDGKRFKIVRPDVREDPNYILNKIINRVTAVKWVNDSEGKGVKTFPIKEKYPDIFNIVTKNGLPEDSEKVKWDKGWIGQQILVMNVIDRERMDEHRALNHTMLLSKNANTGMDGSVYYDDGISAYASEKKLEHLFRSYGSWEKYDIAITRTGNLNEPYLMVNATNSPMEVPAAARNFVSTEPGLTEEEKNFKRYDLSQLYRYTSSTKIYNKLKNTIARIDKYLDTDFLKQLEDEVEKEKVLFAELYKDEREEASAGKEESITIPPVANPVVKQTEPVSAPAPAVRTRTSAIEAAPGSNLPYYNTLSDELKKHIIRAVIKADGTCDIDWDVPADTLAGCPTCGTAAPLEATECPFCGIKF